MLRVISGDNELSALEFMTHYRLTTVMLMDPSLEFQTKYHQGGWPFMMLTSPEGKVVFQKTTLLDRDYKEITGLLDKMAGGTKKIPTIQLEQSIYTESTIARSGEKEKAKLRERFPSIACGPNGQVYTAYTTNRNGNRDVYLKVIGGQQEIEDRAIAATEADEYDGQVLVDKAGNVRLCWVSNADGKNYNIYCALLSDISSKVKPVQVTRAKDDAMHGRLVCDEEGNVWLAYYEWRKMGPNSRDKEVYVKRFKNDKWSVAVRVSPNDVPEYEDHSEPAIAAVGKEVMVAWSWDFHKPKNYPSEGEAPTIFVRRVDDKMRAGDIAIVSGEHIEMLPAMAVDSDSNVWFAWESLKSGRDRRDRKKAVGTAILKAGAKNKALHKADAAEGMFNVCTPDFAVSSDGKITLVWSETADGKNWILKKNTIVNGEWSSSQIIESEGNPRFASADYDDKGDLWIAYSAETEGGRRIVIKNISGK